MNCTRICVLVIWAAMSIPCTVSAGAERLFGFLSLQGASAEQQADEELTDREALQDFTVYEPSPIFEAVIRGQSPQTFGSPDQQWMPQGQMMQNDPYFGGGGMQQPGMGQPGMGQPGMGQPGMGQQDMMQPGMQFGQPQPGYDPFMSSPYSGLQPDPFGTMYDINGPQPARLGWTNRWDFLYQPSSGLADGGTVTVYGANWAADYMFQGANGWLWTLTPEVNYRMYNFSGSGNPIIQPGIADNYYRFAHRFQATSPSAGPFSYRLGFTPAVATDMQSHLNSQAWQFDADATMFYRSSPQWMWVAGVMYWDRARDMIIPHAGAVWNPNQFWEIRAVFPNPRVDVFVGTPFGLATWLYAGAEYHVEAFHAGEIQATKPVLQVEEWRAFAGVRWEGCRFSSYVDFGYAFDRKWNVHSGFGTSDLAPNDAFMIRYGVRY